VRPLISALDPKSFSYNSPQGWCPRCRGFGELFDMPTDVDRGARAEDIEESWFDWMEGRRERCPDCDGTRLNPLARAARLLVHVPAVRLRDPTITEFPNFRWTPPHGSSARCGSAVAPP